MSTMRERNLQMNAKDNTTPVFLGMARTIRAVSREIHFFTMILNMLEKQEMMTGFAATAMGTALRFAIPGLGLVAGLIGIVAAVQLTKEGTITPVGQTMPGEFREIKSRNPIIPDVGEVLGRPMSFPMSGHEIKIGPVYISNEGDTSTQAWQRIRDEVRRLAFPWPR